HLPLDAHAVLDGIWLRYGRVKPNKVGGKVGRRSGIQKRIWVGRVSKQDARQMLPVIKQKIEKRVGTGAVVKNSSAAPQNRLGLLSYPIGEGQPRRELSIVSKNVLPVIAQA